MNSNKTNKKQKKKIVVKTKRNQEKHMLCRLLYYAITDTQGSLLSNIIGKEKDNEENTLCSVTDIFKKFILIKLPFHRPSYLPDVIGDTFFGDNSRYIICDDDNNETKSSSCCLYINGIMMTELETIEKHKKQLKHKFPLLPSIHYFYNATDSFFTDIYECILNKQTIRHSEASYKFFALVVRKIVDPRMKKVVLIAHSQGTILVSTMLAKLKELGLDKECYINKLEIYLFSNCSTTTKYVLPDKKLPYIENITNQHDFVSRFGMTSSQQELIDIDGEMIIMKDKYGHLFGRNYINQSLETFPEFKDNSRLMQYVATNQTRRTPCSPFASYFS